MKFSELSAEEAAELIKPDEVLAVSGFTAVGDPKVVPSALARRAQASHARGRPYRLTLYTGASVSDQIDGALSRAHALAVRLPFQSNRDLRAAINRGEVLYLDLHLSSVSAALRNGVIARPRTAIIEAAELTDDGKLYPTLSSGNTNAFCATAEQIIVELNGHYGTKLHGLHDVYDLEAPPKQGIIPVLHAGDRIGTPYIQLDPKKVVAVVRTTESSGNKPFRAVDDTAHKIAAHFVEFLVHEEQRGRVPRGLPFQAGVGNVSNAVIACLAGHPQVHRISMFTEVVQDSVFNLIDAEKLQVASTSALALSDEGERRFLADIERYKRYFVLRPIEVANHPELIRRLGVISLNTAVEIDFFGNVNVTHVRGSSMLNGIGGSGDFCRNAFLSVYMASSTTKGGVISSIVPLTPHVDHNEHSVQVVVTEHGFADLRGKAPRERAPLIIENCADPKFRPALMEVWEDFLKNAPGKHTPLVLERAFQFYERFL